MRLIDYSDRVDILTAVLSKRGMTKSMGVSSTTIRRWAAGTQNPNKNNAIKINRRFRHYSTKVFQANYKVRMVHKDTGAVDKKIIWGKRAVKLIDFRKELLNLDNRKLEFIKNYEDDFYLYFDKLEIVSIFPSKPTHATLDGFV